MPNSALTWQSELYDYTEYDQKGVLQGRRLLFYACPMDWGVRDEGVANDVKVIFFLMMSLHPCGDIAQICRLLVSALLLPMASGIASLLL